MLIHNCHTHIFSFETIPENILPCGLVRFLAKWRVLRPLARLLNRFIPLSSTLIFDRFLTFLDTGLRPQKAIFQELKQAYPEGTKFVVLSMDQAYRGAGGVPQPFEQQLEELEELKQLYPEVLLPFIFVDPRRDNIVSLACDYLTNRGFAGIKLYPQYGYFPSDERLEPLYEFAQTHQIPIIPHTAAFFGDYRGSNRQLWELLNKCPWPDLDLDAVIRKLSRRPHPLATKRQKICSFFGHPVQYIYLLHQYPQLKISFAHMGADWDNYPPSQDDITKYAHIVKEIKTLLENQEDSLLLRQLLEEAFQLNWLFLIAQMIREYENVYADISFTLSNFDYCSLLNQFLADDVLRTKILFGTDFYMVQLVTDEQTFNNELRNRLGITNYRQIAEINPQAFLARTTIIDEQPLSPLTPSLN